MHSSAFTLKAMFYLVSKLPNGVLIGVLRDRCCFQIGASGETSTTGLGPDGQRLPERRTRGEAAADGPITAVDALPRLTCRTTPQKQRDEIPGWWKERASAFARQEALPETATGWCYDCSVGTWAFPPFLGAIEQPSSLPVPSTPRRASVPAFHPHVFPAHSACFVAAARDGVACAWCGALLGGRLCGC